jgi:sulfide:quinone oxidoreductase
MKKNMEKEMMIDLIENQLKQSNISRRDALKMMGLSSAAFMMGGTTQAEAATIASASTNKSAHIVIVGAGAGGIMMAARMRSAASNAKITVIAPNEVHLYQPGQVFMAAGLYTLDDIKGDNNSLMPSGVDWIKDKVVEYDPDNNSVKTLKGQTVKYDYLIVAAGISYQYDQIEGLTEDMIGKNGISSVYLNNPEAGTAVGGTATEQWFKDMREAAKKASVDNPIKVICTQPNTPIKCGGAPQKIMYLSNDNLRGNGPDGGEDVHMNAKYYFTKAGKGLFGIKEYNATLENEVQPMYGNIENKWKHNLIKIDANKKIATYEVTTVTKGAWDEDLEEYEMVKSTKIVDMEYDFIHIVPPMSASNEFKNSKLAWQKGSAKGWMELDKDTMQHRRYKNVFGIGDVAGIPKGKTGGTARHQAAVLQDNLVAVMNDQEPKHKFDGYTVCPLKTQYGKILMAEFNYGKDPAPSFPILDPSVPRSIWWVFDLYMLKTMYWQLMMRGLM